VITKKGEKHHFRQKIAKMEIVLDLCASKEATHENHVGRT
jgi:hypothetical protein